MGEVTRQTAKREVLKLKPCPFCEGDVTAGDYGYSSFNPGWAKCEKCNRDWKLGSVTDAWQAGMAWNRLQPKAVAIEKAEGELERLKSEALGDGWQQKEE